MSICSGVPKRAVIDVGRTQLSRQMRGSCQSVLCITGETGRRGQLNGPARVPAGEDTMGTDDRPGLSRSRRPAGRVIINIAAQADDAAMETFMPAQRWAAK
jgi:hypothetical protein